MIGFPLQLCFYFAVATNGGFLIEPGTRRRRRIPFSAEAILVDGILPVTGHYHVGKIGVVNVPTMKLLCSRPFEGVLRGLIDEGSQKFSFRVSKQHD